MTAPSSLLRKSRHKKLTWVGTRSLSADSSRVLPQKKCSLLPRQRIIFLPRMALVHCKYLWSPRESLILTISGLPALNVPVTITSVCSQNFHNRHSASHAVNRLSQLLNINVTPHGVAHISSYTQGRWGIYQDYGLATISSHRGHGPVSRLRRSRESSLF